MPTLIDGREVASDSEEWRKECLARHSDRVGSLLAADYDGRILLRESMLSEMIESGRSEESASISLKESNGCAETIYKRRIKASKKAKNE